jgi:hypothetical protein
MKANWKRTLAKEVLYLYVSIGVVLLAYCSCVVYNEVFSRNLERLTVIKKTYFLNNNNLKLRQDLLNTLQSSEFGWDYFSYDMLWQSFEAQDSSEIVNRWNTLWDEEDRAGFRLYGINSGEELAQFVKETHPTEEQSLRLKKLENKINSINLLSKDEIFAILCFVVFTTVLILFFLRYFYLVFLWALKTIQY